MGAQPGLSAQDRRHLVHKITSGVPNTAYQLMILSDYNIDLLMSRTLLEIPSLNFFFFFFFFLHRACAAGCHVEGWTSHDMTSLTLRMRSVL